MRVLHLVTNTEGGAGRAALRLHQAQKIVGIDSILLTRQSKYSYSTKSKMIQTFFSIFGKCITLIGKIISKSEYGLVTPFSSPVLGLQEIFDLKPDLVHIHNWYNFISIDEIKKIMKKYPTIFTLHDERLLTGGCHYTYNCNSFHISCTDCPAIKIGQHLISYSKNNFDSIFNMNIQYGIISPSNWLLQKAKLAPVGKNALVSRKILNIIGDEFRVEKYTKRKNLIPTILFVASNLEAHIKGLDMLLEAGNRYCTKYNLELRICLIGEGQCPTISEKNDRLFIEKMGLLTNPELKSRYLDSDLVAVVSREDNSPNVIGEAMSLGLPVLGTKVGGIPEIIIDGFNGVIVDLNSESICDGLFRAIVQLSLDTMGENAFKSSQTQYSIENIVDLHLRSYGEVIENHR